MLRLATVTVLVASVTPAAADVGAMVDAGVPSGAGVSLLYRPLSPLRVHAGVAHNGIAPGVAAGVTITTPGGVMRPTLTVEGGRFFEGDANGMYTYVAGAPDEGAPERFGYDFGSAHVGVELGTSWFAWYLRGGVSAVRATLGQDGSLDDDDTSTRADVEVSAVTPSVRTGFVIYLGD